MKDKIAKLLIRAGLAFVFIYATIEIYLNPINFFKYIPGGILSLVNGDYFLTVLGLGEVGLALWLLSGWKGRFAALISALFLTGIVLFNGAHFYILFRNIAIILAALALFVLESPLSTKKEKYPL
jgi:uncharacterized membrane protein YphA (DoxX/SURF4 family)